jgi:hypothetical protein
LRVRGIVSPLKGREFLASSFADRINEFRIRMTDEVQKGPIFGVLFPHEQQGNVRGEEVEGSAHLERFE